MGSAASSPQPNVLERHRHAYFVNVRLTPEQAASLQQAYTDADRLPLQPFQGSCWLSLLFDELEVFHLYTPLLRRFVRLDPMRGPQCKINLMAADARAGIGGYLMTQVDFDASMKVLGAKASQKVPAHICTMRIPPLTPTAPATVSLQTSSNMLIGPGKGGACVFQATVVDRDLTPEEMDLAAFVARRDRKYLYENGSRATYCPVTATTEEQFLHKIGPCVVAMDGCRLFTVDSAGVDSIRDFLSVRLPGVDFKSLDVWGFYLPGYDILDHAMQEL